jgi:hypothetical protein
MAVMGSEIQFKSYGGPAHLAEALDPSAPVFFISDLVEGLDLEIFERHYAEMGETIPRPSPTSPVGFGSEENFGLPGAQVRGFACAEFRNRRVVPTKLLADGG